MNQADTIWNRALDGGGRNPVAGDRALAALLRLHSLVMNGGVLHALEVVNSDGLSAADLGYRYFGCDRAAELLRRGRELLRKNVDLGTYEAALDAEYASLADDAALMQRFRRHLADNPGDFSPAS